VTTTHTHIFWEVPFVEMYEPQEKARLREGVPEGREMVAGVRSEERAETPDHVPQTELRPGGGARSATCQRKVVFASGLKARPHKAQGFSPVCASHRMRAESPASEL